jgi:hypothetical protein
MAATTHSSLDGMMKTADSNITASFKKELT